MPKNFLGSGPENFVGIIGHGPSVSKSNQLHVVTFWVLFN